MTVSVGGLDDTAGSRDYAAVGAFNLTIPARATSGTATFTFAPTDDVLGEGAETLTVTGATTAYGLSVDSAELTLADDETVSTSIALSLSPTSVAENGGAQDVAVTATLDADARSEATTVSVTVGAGSDSAASGDDYGTVSPFALTIAAGATSETVTFTITPTNDLTSEGAERITVSGTTANGLSVTSARLTLADDDMASTSIALSLTPSSVMENGGAQDVAVAATLDAAARSDATTVSVTVGAGTDSAMSGDDYGAVSAFDLTIARGATSETFTFTITPTADRMAEGAEQITVSGTTASALSVTSAQLALRDTPLLTLGLSDMELAEGDTADSGETAIVTATVNPPHGAAFTATVAGASLDGTRWQFVGTNRTLSFTAGATQSTGTVRIQALANELDDGDLQVTVTATPDTSAVRSAEAVLTIADDDMPTVTLMLDDTELMEGETATVTARASSGYSEVFTVEVAVPVSNRYGFARANRMLSFASGAVSSAGTVRIRAVDNDKDDADVEGIEVTGTSSVPDMSVVRAMFVVLDDDSPGVSIAAPLLARNTGHVFEAEAADLTATGGPWVLRRVGMLDAALAVTVAVSESGGDFVASATETMDQTVTFAATADTANYTPVTADTTDEAHGAVTVTLQAGADYDIEGDAAASADVRDDDGTGAGALLVLGAAPATLTVAEGNAAQVSVAAKTVEDGTFTQTGDLGRVFAGATSATVDASTGGGTATAGTDYTALTSGTTVTVRFADLTVSGRGLRLAAPAALPAVQTTADNAADDNETFVVTLTKAAGTNDRIGLDPATATVKIVEGPPNGSLRICDADGQCVTGDGVSCLASDPVCVNGLERDVPAEGRLEVAWDGLYGTVCDDYWTNTDADVACRDIGHAAVQRSFVRSHFGGAQPGVPIWFDDVKCLGSEATLAACPRSGGTSAAGSHNCPLEHTEDAGLRCLVETTEAPTVEVRPKTLSVAPGETVRYWVALTKRPDNEDFWAAPRAPPGGAVTVSPDKVWITNDEQGWSFAQWVDVTASAGARIGESHTIVHETSAYAYLDGTVPAVPDVTVTVAAPVDELRPEGAWASDVTVTVMFGAPLDSAFAPSSADFVVLAGEAERRVAAAYVKGAELVLKLALELPAGAPVRVAYPPAPSSPLADASGRLLAPFELMAVRWPAAPRADDRGDRLPDGALEAPWTAADGEPFAPAPGAVVKREGAAGLTAAVAEALRDAPGPEAATLWAPRRGVVDLSELAALPALRRANLSDNAVTDLGPLAGLAELQRLDLSGNAATDVWPLSVLAGLEVLDLSGNRIADVTALGGLPRLKVLELAGNAVTDISPLLHLTELRYLGLSGNRVAHAAPLAHLAGLLRLDLSGNRIADAGPLGNLSQLVWLRLPGNRLERVDALGRLTELRWVWLADNPALAPDAAAVLPAGVWTDTGADGAAR